MKKIILSIVAIGSLIALSGCSQPDTKKTYAANQKVYQCGYWEVVLTPVADGKIYEEKVVGRTEDGLPISRRIAKKVDARMSLNNYGNKDETYLYPNGTFIKKIPVNTMGRAMPDETWSFRKQSNGKYFFGTSKFPNPNNVIAGNWCERKH